MAEWHYTYLPREKITGTVLDLGAGCGETARLFLNHGATHVIAVEPNKTALEHLYHNYGQDPRVTIVPLGLDLIKVDVDGAEEDMCIEGHWPSEWQIIKGLPRPDGGVQEYVRLVRR